MRLVPLSLRLVTTSACLVVLGACASSPPVNYYTLMRPAATAPQTAPRSDALIDVVPVTVPVQVDQPQIMVRTNDAGVVPLYSERWVAPLADEVRAAVSDGLTRTLGVFDVQAVKPSREQPVWRVQVDVQRFDSIDGEAAIVDATWRLRGINMNDPNLLCRTRIVQATTGSGVPALVAAHQAALAQLSETIASRISAGVSQSGSGSNSDICQTNGKSTG